MRSVAVRMSCGCARAARRRAARIRRAPLLRSRTAGGWVFCAAERLGRALALSPARCALLFVCLLFLGAIILSALLSPLLAAREHARACARTRRAQPSPSPLRGAARLWQLWARRDHASHCAEVRTATVGTGALGFLGNKVRGRAVRAACAAASHCIGGCSRLDSLPRP